MNGLFRPKVLFFLLILNMVSCSITRDTSNIFTAENCLTLDPLNYHNVQFNPQWIAKNRIKKIIEREYLDGRNGKIHLVSVMYYNNEGYIQTLYRGKGYPKDDSPNEDDVSSKAEYTYSQTDSFDIQTHQIIRFHNGEKDLVEPDTLPMVIKLFNRLRAKNFVNEHSEHGRSYHYDEHGRLIKETYGNGEELYSLKFNPENTIEIEEYSTWLGKTINSLITLNDKGQIIRNFDKSNGATHEFKYNSKGKMIEEKSWFKDKEPIYYIYEYVR